MTSNITWHIKRHNSNNNNKKQIVYDIQYYQFNYVTNVNHFYV